ncbi:hypothetical protein CVT24_012647 [Panaeolus cyanescens]|uniref:Phosphatidylinositol-specific phospholipase C X domain-containing protein n=1 Tax=Panaeolus cyanescens TaxID=181874 RepID=A0A409W2C0_9AGAR|nr:hypothetical protein CVT24_012647 [Panaeolus cyanescens]
MAPDSSKKWMQIHRHIFGDLPISELCIPASHDAGTYRRGFHTAFGTESNVFTQSRSIFDQLELGVRCFDIRPYLTCPAPGTTPGHWACGHYTEGEEIEKIIGWQGANCVEIQEVIDDINRFTKDNAELVVLEIDHVFHVVIDNPISTTGRNPTQDEWNTLISLLSKIDNLYTVERAGTKRQALQDCKLNQFIGDGKAAVLVLVNGYPGNPDDLYNTGLWPMNTPDGQTLSLNSEWVTHTANLLEEIKSTINLLQLFGPEANPDSILSLAKKYQDEHFPWLLQKFAANGYPSLIWMDRIQSPDLLTFCIATAYQRFNIEKGLRNLVVVYGGFLITSPQVHQRIRDAIDNGKSFVASDANLGGTDPWPTMVKSCVVFYEQNGFVKGRFAREGDLLHFEQDVLSIEYGERSIRNQKVYYNLLEAIANKKPFLVNNESMGIDPEPGVYKKCAVRFRDINSEKIREVQANEEQSLNF